MKPWGVAHKYSLPFVSPHSIGACCVLCLVSSDVPCAVLGLVFHSAIYDNTKYTLGQCLDVCSVLPVLLAFFLGRPLCVCLHAQPA